MCQAGRSSLTVSHGIVSRTQDAIATWTIDRPEVRNALCLATLVEFKRLALEAAKNDSLRAVVITGSGDQAFCAGADLKERRRMSREQALEFLQTARSAMDAIDRMPRPVIAAINGVALGGGLELALACDLRVLHREAKVGLPETKLAIIPGAGGTQRLSRAIGPGRAKRMILLGETIAADEAERLGVVEFVCEPGETALERARDIASTLVTRSPLALETALASIDGGLDLRLPKGSTTNIAVTDEHLILRIARRLWPRLPKSARRTFAGVEKVGPSEG